MKKSGKLFALISILLMSFALQAQDAIQNNDNGKKKKEKIYNEKGELIKKGWNFGPLPVVGFNSDLGFQYGACVDIFNYGDGSRYPKFDYKMNLEVSAYTKGSLNLRFYGDYYSLIPNSRLFVDAGYFTDKRFEFYGFNGYASPYYNDLYVLGQQDNGQQSLIENYNNPDFNSVFYRMDRKQFRFNSCLRTKFGFGEHLYYGVGLSYFNYNMGRINIQNEEYAYDQQITLYELYRESGLIRADEADGGNVTQLKLAFIYDSKNHDSDPTRGAYFEATLTGAPDIIDGDGYSHATFNAVWQHYIPVVAENLTFAYRVVTQNVIAGEIPYYAAFNSNMLFYKKMYTDAMGGVNSVRGINRNRVIGAGYAWLNAELRWKVVGFQFINQNWNVALNPFFDAGMVTQSYRLDEQKEAWNKIEEIYDMPSDYKNLIYSGQKEGIHTSAGCGLKLIMNRNFIISAEAAKALNARDGEGMRVYIGFNYLF
ncbi:MAG: hypothetical protein IIW55_06105 [Bacteroidales bacterium]|nr:hypothetical protein [Bacteroidales bacterium]